MDARTDSRILSRIRGRAAHLAVLVALGSAPLPLVPHSAQSAETQPAAAVAPQKSFKTPEAAFEALIVAAERYDVPALKEMLGPDGEDLVAGEDPVQDKNRLTAFAAQARQKTRVDRNPKNQKIATLCVGAEDWPLPIPVVEERGAWRFDSKAGRQEILYRRIGENELNAITLCHGYVEAQRDYASQKRGEAQVVQYAQRIVSTPGKRDGLAWRAADGTWQGVVGEEIAQVIAEGYTDRAQPYHGYFFKVLKGQGPNAPMGEMDYVVKGLMIGGFALVAAPADYSVSGVKTFIVSNGGVVYEKDLGEKTLDQFRAMERFDPDPTWVPVKNP
jgi:hypothetical protein